MSPAATAETTDPPRANSFSESRALILQIILDPSQKDQVSKLVGDEAQCIADFLCILLHEDGTLENEEIKGLLKLLRKLVKSSGVLPECYKLRGVECGFGLAEKGGGFGDVFEGRYREQKICVKAIRIFGDRNKEKALKDFAGEMILWAHLSHPNILSFYGVYLEKRICIISPWMEKGELSSYLGNFPQIPRMPLVFDIITGLLYLHQSGIVHGDLKAENILVSDEGRALIGDFGISHIAMTTNPSSLLSSGTLRWAAPELLQAIDSVSNPRPTMQSDVWSFGCVCYEVFTRQVPFYQYTTSYLLLVLLRGSEIPCRPEGGNHDYIEDDMWGLMTRCWNHTPKDRPGCEEVHQAISNIRGTQDKQMESTAGSPPMPWKDLRGGSMTVVDYGPVHRILSDIRHKASRGSLISHAPAPPLTQHSEPTKNQTANGGAIPGLPDPPCGTSTANTPPSSQTFTPSTFHTNPMTNAQNAHGGETGNPGDIQGKPSPPQSHFHDSPSLDATPVLLENNPLPLPTPQSGNGKENRNFWERDRRIPFGRPGLMARSPSLSAGYQKPRAASVPGDRRGQQQNSLDSELSSTMTTLQEDSTSYGTPMKNVQEATVVGLPPQLNPPAHTTAVAVGSGPSDHGSTSSSPVGISGFPASSKSAMGRDGVQVLEPGDTGQVWRWRLGLKRPASTTPSPANVKRAALSNSMNGSPKW